MRVIGIPGAAIFVVLFACVGAFAQGPTPTLFATAGLSTVLNGSAYRHVGALNKALRPALAACRKWDAESKVPLGGSLSAATGAAVQVLRECPGYAFPGEAGSANVTVALWQKLLPDIPPPNAFERMFIITLTLEGTDYDHFEWNYDTVDPDAFATWGPYGATVGEGSQIQAILNSVEKDHPGVVRAAFERAAALDDRALPKPEPWRATSRAADCRAAPAEPSSDYELFRAISSLKAKAVAQPLKAAYCSDRRYGIWIKTFEFLGAIGAVRKAYDDVYFKADDKVSGYIKRTRDAYAAAGVEATEIDLAMGIDGASHLATRYNLAKVRDAVKSAGKAATPARRRSAISEALPATRSDLKDRCGRDAVFFIDAFDNLPPAKTCKTSIWDLRRAWRDRAGFSVSVAQLSDQPAPNFAAGWTHDFDN